MNVMKSEKHTNIMILKSSLISIGFMGLAIILGQVFLWFGLSETNIVIVFILFVLLTARCTKGYIYGIVTAVASIFLYNFFFTEPYFTLAVNNPDYVLTFGVMMITAIITCAMTSKVQKKHKRGKRTGNTGKNSLHVIQSTYGCKGYGRDCKKFNLSFL